MTRPNRPGRQRRPKPERRRPAGRPGGGTHRLYGLHAVRAALANPERRTHRLLATEAAAKRLEADAAVEITDGERLSALVGRDAVHQGVVLECEPLDRLDQSELFRFADARLVVVLDQVTDPHNVGAILRTTVAMGADGVVVTARNGAPETAVLAKSASGALDMIPILEARTLGAALGTLREHGYLVVGLDSDGESDLAATFAEGTERIALVLGSEGRGLREGTRAACERLARLDMPGPIRSLNVSNAATLALYLARGALDRYSSKPR